MEAVADLDESGLIAALVKERLDEPAARLLVAVWLDRVEQIAPSHPKHEERLQGILQAAVRLGWNTKTKQAAHQGAAAKEENKVPVNAVSEKVTQLAKAYEREHGVSFAVAMDKILAEDPGLKAEYLFVPGALTPTDPDSARVLERMRQYQREHPGASAAEAYSAVLAGDPGLAKSYGRK